MKPRHLFALLALIVLMLAPFGRIAAAQAMAMSHHAAAAMPGHCGDMPIPDDGDADNKAEVECMIACAVMAVADSPRIEAMPLPASVPVRRLLPDFAGLHPEADPPPPRIS